MGQGPLEFAAGQVADRIYAAILPRLSQIVKKAAEAAEPTIRTVIREEVLPKVALYGIGGLALVGGLAALIGALVAKRG